MEFAEKTLAGQRCLSETTLHVRNDTAPSEAACRRLFGELCHAGGVAILLCVDSVGLEVWATYSL